MLDILEFERLVAAVVVDHHLVFILHLHLHFVVFEVACQSSQVRFCWNTKENDEPESEKEEEMVA